MDIGEMVDQLVEKRLTDFIDGFSGDWRRGGDPLNVALSGLLAEMISAKVEAKKDDLKRAMQDYVDSCEIVVEIDHRGPRLELNPPKGGAE